MTSCDIDDMIDVTSDEFNYLDSVDNWLSFESTSGDTLTTADNSDIFEWIQNAFSSEKSRGAHKALVTRLDEIKWSPSIDSRTFTRQKRNLQKRQSLFNGTKLSTLCSPVNEDDSSPEANDRTFEITSGRKSLNGTFVKAADSTFSVPNEELNNIEDVEKIAQRQEDSLRQSCRSESNGYSTPSQRNNETFSRINSNTLTKSRDPDRLQQIENQYNYLMNGQNGQTYDNGILSPEESFHQNARISSTPLVSKYRQTAQEVFREPIVPKIMPDVSNLKTHSRYGQNKVGRSEPNISRLLPMSTKGTMGFNGRTNPMSNRTTGIASNSTLIHTKMASDSRLMAPKNGLRHPSNHNQTQTLGRVMSPPPSQSHQLLNRKVAVEEGFKTNATNLCRKSTFRVRDMYAMNSEENLKENGNETQSCLTNTSASTNKSDNNCVQRNVSKIPGPKPIRSGIPVCGQRTAVPCPPNHRPTINSTDNSWKNGCF